MNIFGEQQFGTNMVTQKDSNHVVTHFKLDTLYKSSFDLHESQISHLR